MVRKQLFVTASFVLLLAFAFAAHAEGASAAGGAPKGRIAKTFAKEWGCPKDEIAVEEIQDSKWVEGGLIAKDYEVCGCENKAILSIAVFMGFVYRIDDYTLRERFSVETGCESQDVIFHYIDEKTRIAEACGSRYTYLFSGTLLYGGAWVLNSTIENPVKPDEVDAPETEEKKLDGTDD